MEPWSRSSVTLEVMEELISRGLLLVRTMVEVWWLLDVHDSPAPPAGYVVLFTVGIN
jgi:hypothetical protein